MLIALVLPLALLSACGDDSDSSATDPAGTDTTSAAASESPGESPSATDEPSETASKTPDPPDWPACDSVWVGGGTIPTRYKGCLEGNNAVAADNLSCSSGQRIVRYADRFYGVAGGKIYATTGPLEKDKAYLKMIRSCRA